MLFRVASEDLCSFRVLLPAYVRLRLDEAISIRNYGNFHFLDIPNRLAYMLTRARESTYVLLNILNVEQIQARYCDHKPSQKPYRSIEQTSRPFPF